MRLLILFLLAGFMHVSANSYAQYITFTGKSVPLEKALEAIRNQGGYEVTASRTLLQSASRISVEAKAMPVAQFLKLILEGQPLEAKTREKTIILSPKKISRSNPATSHPKTGTEAIQQLIRGRVTNEKGEPLAGASIYVLDVQGKRTAVQTKTDEQGYFELGQVQEGAKLEVAYLGYATQKLAAHAEIGIVTLKPFSAEVEEVEVLVNTGYQTLPKERATGSFESVDMEKFDQLVGSNAIERLEGLATSLQFDRTTMGGEKITIRGASTIEGPSNILVVVDNFPFEGDISTLNPNDIASITFLKDGAASSIWGTRAGNGVVVITTKKGAFSSRLNSSFRSSLTIGNKVRLDNIPMLNSINYIEFEKYKFSNGYKISEIENPTRPIYASPVYELFFQADSGKIGQDELEAKLNLLSDHNLLREYESKVYSHQINQQYSWDISSGAERFSWFASVIRDQNKSELKEKFIKTGIAFSGQFRPWKSLELSVGARYTGSTKKSGKDGYDDSLPIYSQLIDDQGDPVGIAKSYRQSFIDNFGEGLLKDWNYYPFTDASNKSNHVAISHFLANSNLSYRFWRMLKLSVNYQFEQQGLNDRFIYGEDSYYARNLLNTYSQINNRAVKYIVPEGGILDIQNSLLVVNNLRFQLDLDKSWGNSHLTGLAGFELRERKLEGYQQRRYGYSEKYNSFLNHDPVSRYPNIITGTSSLIPSNDGLLDGNNRFLSGYLNAAYTYKDKYVVTLSGRRDASNLFGLNVNEKWNLLWSVGGAWNLGKERWFQERNLKVDNLKIRATYGFSGNVDPSKSAVTTMFYGLQNQYVNQPIGSIQQYANPELKWEKVNIANFGIDFTLLSNKIKGNIDYFIKKSTDLFGPVEADYTTGLNGMITKNTASLRGKGIDVNLELDVMTRTDVKWTSNILLSYYNDKLKKYYLNPSFTVSTVITSSTPMYNRIEEYPLYSMYSYRWKGLDRETGDPVGYLNGQESKDYSAIANSKEFDNLVFSGAAIPTYFGSFSNSFRYKKWTGTIRFQYNLGYYFRRNTVDYFSMLDRPGASHPDYLLRWQKPGDEKWTDIPSFEYPVTSERINLYRFSEQTVERGDHVRIQHVSVARDFNIKSVSAYIRGNGDQLGIIWRRNNKKIDPVYQNSIYLPPSLWSIVIGVKF